MAKDRKRFLNKLRKHRADPEQDRLDVAKDELFHVEKEVDVVRVDLARHLRMVRMHEEYLGGLCQTRERLRKEIRKIERR